MKICLPITIRWWNVSPPMPIKDRAAQFAPFAALSGHREALAEEIKKYDEDLGYQ